MINCEKSKYFIVYDKYIIVEGFHPTGMPIYSTSNRLNFETYDHAMTYLISQLQHLVFTSPDVLIPSELTKYEVMHMVSNYNSVGKPGNSIANAWIRAFDDVDDYPEDNANYHLVRGLLKCSVLNGWKVVGLVKETILDTLQNPKYSNIVENSVPMHMIENFDLFWDNGLKTCSPEELGAIMLTSSNHVLEFLEVDKYNVSR